MTFRLLITGSRTWDDEVKVRFWLERYVALAAKKAERPTLISGHCLSGADAICEHIAREVDFHIETYPANWQRDGRSAGFVRNRYMVVNTNPTHCIAFIRNHSNGATMTRDLAKEKGIPTKTILYALHS